jgi:hypothetical protein
LKRRKTVFAYELYRSGKHKGGIVLYRVI